MSHIKSKSGPFCSTQNGTSGKRFLKNKIIGKRKSFSHKSHVLSPHSAKFRSFPSLSRCFSLLLPLHWSLHQSSKLCSPFLLQITKGSHFRSREAHLYVVGLQISGLGILLLTWFSWVLGFWEIWWVVLLSLCIMVVICEGICRKHAKLVMLMWAKITHSVLGFYDDALWYLCVEFVDRNLVEMMGKVNLGLNVRMTML